jgi:hypothetical protein
VKNLSDHFHKWHSAGVFHQPMQIWWVAFARFYFENPTTIKIRPPCPDVFAARAQTMHTLRETMHSRSYARGKGTSPIHQAAH